MRIRYGIISTGLGPILLARSEYGYVSSSYGERPEKLLGKLALQFDELEHQDRAVADAAKQLKEYLHSKRRDFELPLSLELASEFQRQVLSRLQTLDYGQVTTYGTLARELQNPDAGQAVGGALRSNPLPILIPCHRVIRSDRALGGYIGGVDRKVQLLELEGVLLKELN